MPEEMRYCVTEALVRISPEDACVSTELTCRISELYVYFRDDKLLYLCCFDIYFVIDNVTLEKVDQYRYLGLCIDSHLNFPNHRDSLINTVNNKIYFFKKIRRYITTEAASTIYKGTILPILEYADFVFDYGIKYVNNKLQSIQNQGLYTVYNQHYLTYDLRDSTETLHRKANLMRLVHRRNVHMLGFIFNYTKDRLLLDNRDIRTRRHDDVLFQIMSVEHFKVKQDPMRRATCAWNELPIEIRNVENKDHLKKMMINEIPNPYASLR